MKQTLARVAPWLSGELIQFPLEWIRFMKLSDKFIFKLLPSLSNSEVICFATGEIVDY